MKTVKFTDAGRWAESDPLLPQFEVAAGEEVLVTDGLADIIVTAKRGKIIPADKTESAMLAQKQIEADAAGQESDAVKEITTRIAGLMSEEDFLALTPDLAGKSSSELSAVFADLEATKQGTKEADRDAAKKKNPATKDKGKAESK